MVSNSLLSSSSTLPPHISRGVGPVTVVHLSVQSHVSGPPPFLYRLRSLERNTILPRPYQVHDFGPCCRYGLARSCYRQDGPCNARRNQPAGLFSQFVTPSKFWLLPSPNMKMRRAPKLQVLSVADFTLAIGRTICHGSDSVENAEEIKLWVFSSLLFSAHDADPYCAFFLFSLQLVPGGRRSVRGHARLLDLRIDERYSGIMEVAYFLRGNIRYKDKKKTSFPARSSACAPLSLALPGKNCTASTHDFEKGSVF